MGKYFREHGQRRLRTWIDKLKDHSDVIPEYIANIGRMVAPRAEIIWDAIAKLAKDDSVSPELKLELTEILKEMIVESEKATNNRWELDTKSESWLSRNIRPLSTLIVLVNFIVIEWISAFSFETFSEDALDRAWKLAFTAMGAYFALRGAKQLMEVGKGELKSKIN